MYRRTFWIVLITALPLLAQSNGTIAGQVTDLSKAVVPGARVVVMAVDTGVAHRTTTNSEGYYTVPSLAPTDYVVTAEMDGFKKSTSATLKLDTTATARIDLVLVPMDSKETVEVTAVPPSLETETSMTGGTVSGKEVENLPLQGRNSLELALTVAGVSGEMGADEAGISYNIPSSGSGLSVGGGRTATSAILADGSNATSIGYGRATVTFSPDTIQEFKVVTSTFSAQYGVTGGGIISTVSKSGTDELHGNAFWFTRNPALTARTFGQPFASGMRRNEFGVTLGGPVVLPKLYNGKRRTFFFVSYEPKRRRDETAQYEHVPTAAERQGDFRNSWVGPGQTNPLLYQQVACGPGGCNQLVSLNRPNSTAVFPLFSANDPDPTKVGHVIPQQLLDPLVQKMLQFVPLPNMPYDAQGRNFLGVSGVTGSDNRWSAKIDHNFASSNRMSVRYSDIPSLSNRYKLARDNFFAEDPPTDRSLTRQVFLSDSHTISPRMVNEFRGSYTFSDYSRTPSGDLATTNYTKNMFGLPNVTNWGFPQFLAGMLTLGAGINGLGMYIEHQYQFSDDVTMMFGRHTLTAGVDFRFMQSNVKSSGLLEACCGQYNFSANQTASGNANIPGGAGGYQFASFLLGVPNVANLAGTVIPYCYRFKTQAAFFQDDFKVLPSLTLNMGVRWQYLSPRAEKYNRQASLDVNHPIPVPNASGQTTSFAFNYVFSGAASGSRYLEPTHKLNFEPRFGFAWTPRTRWSLRNRFVVRGGYGISHVPATGIGRDPIPNFAAGNSGSWNYTQWTGNGAMPQTQAVNPNCLVSLGRNVPVVKTDPIAQQIPADGLLCSGCTVRDARLPSGTAVSFVGANGSPYIQTWNLTTQIELRRGLVVSLGYMGQKGTHLPSPTININNPDPEKFAALLDQGGDPTQSVPDPFGAGTAQAICAIPRCKT